MQNRAFSEHFLIYEKIIHLEAESSKKLNFSNYSSFQSRSKQVFLIGKLGLENYFHLFVF